MKDGGSLCGSFPNINNNDQKPTRPIPTPKSDFQVAELLEYGTSQVSG